MAKAPHMLPCFPRSPYSWDVCKGLRSYSAVPPITRGRVLFSPLQPSFLPRLYPLLPSLSPFPFQCLRNVWSMKAPHLLFFTLSPLLHIKAKIGTLNEGEKCAANYSSAVVALQKTGMESDERRKGGKRDGTLHGSCSHILNLFSFNLTHTNSSFSPFLIHCPLLLIIALSYAQSALLSSYNLISLFDSFLPA